MAFALVQPTAEFNGLECGSTTSSTSDDETIRGPSGMRFPRRLSTSTAFLGLAVTALVALTCWQQRSVSVSETALSSQVTQKDELEDLRKSLLGDDDVGDDDEDKAKKSAGIQSKPGDQKGQGLAAPTSSQKLLPKFSKCGGGVDWAGSTCCKKGCACIIKSMFFSMCQTPKGAKDCDPLTAKDEIRRAIIRAKIAPGRIKQLKQDAKSAATELPALKKKAARDKKRVTKVEPLGKKIRAKKAAIVKKAKQARAKADEIKKEAAAHGKELWKTRHDNTKLLKAENKTSKAYWKVKGKVQALKKQTHDLTSQINSTEKEALKLEAEAKEVVAKANKIGTLREALELAANKSAKAWKQADERAKDLVAKVARAEKAVKYEAANVNVWRAAAKGETCSKLIAAHVHEAPIVDYGGDEVSDEEAARAQKRAKQAEKEWMEEKEHKKPTHFQ